MSTLLDEPPTSGSHTTASDRLRATMAAARVSFTWFGVRKSLSPQQKAEAADAFGAEGNYLSAGKKLLDTSHPAFRAVTAVRNRATSLWRGLSLPYPEAGIRLIRQQDMTTFDVQMTTLRAELEEAVHTLDAHFSELKGAARERLGRLFNPADYPDTLCGLFEIAWDYPSVEPPEYLRQLSPALYEQETQRVAARFDEAVRLAEEAFASELAKLVSHLSERLSGNEDGKPKIFRDSAVENLTEFFERFRQLNVRSSASSTSWSARPSGSCGEWHPRSCATAPTCGSMWPANWPVCKPCWMGCSSIDHGATSSAERARWPDGASDPSWRHHSLHLRRGVGSERAGQPGHPAGQPRRAGRAGCLARRSGASCRAAIRPLRLPQPGTGGRSRLAPGPLALWSTLVDS